MGKTISELPNLGEFEEKNVHDLASRAEKPSRALNAGLKPATENASFKTNASRLLWWLAICVAGHNLSAASLNCHISILCEKRAMFLFKESKILDPVEKEESGVLAPD